MSTSMSILILALSAVPPALALWLFLAGRGRRWGWVPSLFLLPPYAIAMLMFYPLLPWAFDSLRGWSLRVPVDIPGYRVTLAQEPGSDFYDTWFEIERADGGKARVMIDADDDRWWNPRVVTNGSRICFLRGRGRIDGRTACVDPANGTVFSGTLTHRLAELSYR